MVMTSFSPLTDGDKLLLCPSGRLSLSCLRSSLLPLSLSPSLHLLMHCCSASNVVLYFFTPLILHTPLYSSLSHLFISSHPFTQRIYKRTKERRRLRSTEEHTDAHSHINTSNLYLFYSGPRHLRHTRDSFSIGSQLLAGVMSVSLWCEEEESQDRTQSSVRAPWDPSASGLRVIQRLLQSEERYMPSPLYISLIQREPQRREELAKWTMEVDLHANNQNPVLDVKYVAHVLIFIFKALFTSRVYAKIYLFLSYKILVVNKA